MLNRLIFLKAEVKRSLLMLTRYKIHTITNFIVVYMLFMGIFYGIKFLSPGNQIFGASAGGMIVGYIMWVYVLQGLDVGYSLANEATLGILEQIYMSPVGPLFILFSKAVANAIEGLFFYIPLLILLPLSTNIKLNIPFIPIIIVFILTLMGIYGFGYIFGGLNLIYKKLGPIQQILQFVFLLFAGVLVPIENLPRGLQVFAYSLPLTQGIRCMRMLMVDNLSFMAIVQSGEITKLILNSGIYLLVGMISYLIADRFVRSRGGLAQY